MRDHTQLHWLALGSMNPVRSEITSDRDADSSPPTMGRRRWAAVRAVAAAGAAGGASLGGRRSARACSEVARRATLDPPPLGCEGVLAQIIQRSLSLTAPSGPAAAPSAH